MSAALGFAYFWLRAVLHIWQRRVRCANEHGCDTPSRFCEIDHLLAWIDGGRTDPDNADPKCKRHNLWKERHDRRKRRRQG